MVLFRGAADGIMILIVSEFWWLFAPSLLSPHLVPSVQGKESHSLPNRTKRPLWLLRATRLPLRTTVREISDDATARPLGASYQSKKVDRKSVV